MARATSNHITPESIGSAQLGANSVTQAEIASGAVGLFEMQDNSVGPQALGLEVVSVVRPTLSVSSDRVVATCPAGKRVLSGGYRLTALTASVDPSEMTVIQNGPNVDDATEWIVYAYFPTAPSSWSWNVYAICIIDGT